MHERTHHNHLHVFLGHEQSQALRNVSGLGREGPELAVNSVPREIGGKIGTWSHTGEILLAFDGDRHDLICTNKQRQGILYGAGRARTSVPGDCDAPRHRCSTVARNEEQRAATGEKNVFNHFALGRVARTGNVQDREIVNPCQFHKALRP